LEADPTRRSVTWRQDAQQSVTWAVDGQPYNLTTLIRHIIELATEQPPLTQVWGPAWYRDDNDQTPASSPNNFPTADLWQGNHVVAILIARSHPAGEARLFRDSCGIGQLDHAPVAHTRFEYE